MFDIGFWEISLIMVVALLVIGPERLPGVARKAGLWVNKGRSFISTIKSDIEHEIAADELKKILKDQENLTGIHEIIEETRADISNAISNTKDEIRDNFEGNSMSAEPATEVMEHSPGDSSDTSTSSKKSSNKSSNESNEA